MGKSFRIADSQIAKLNGLLKFHFVGDCRARIVRSTDGNALAAWWNSDGQKQLRRDFAMDPSEVNDLKQAVMDHREKLNPKGKAA